MTPEQKKAVRDVVYEILNEDMQEVWADYFLTKLLPAIEKVLEPELSCERLALREAIVVAEYLWKKCYKDEAPDWEVLPDLRGVISQIDNMVTGVVRQLKPPQEEG